MAQDQGKVAGPDLTKGITPAELSDGGKLLGHVGDEQILLVRRGDGDLRGRRQLHALSAGRSPKVSSVGETVRCPWHHACFDLRTGEALRAPALSPIACWAVEQRDGKIVVGKKLAQPEPKPRGKRVGAEPKRIVIVGGGAAGFAAAEMLRRQKYQGSIVMLSADDAPPVDRPNLSKDYLAGSAPEEWVPLRPDEFYAENSIDLRLEDGRQRHRRARSRTSRLRDGSTVPYDRLLLATGAEPVRLPIPGADQPQCTRCARSPIAARSSSAPRPRSARS